MPKKYIYEPWEAPASVQKAAGVKIGKDYPAPIVDHKVESKENMGKMSYAYDLHKNGQGSKSKKDALSKPKKNVPAKKKRKIQQQLKF